MIIFSFIITLFLFMIWTFLMKKDKFRNIDNKIYNSLEIKDFYTLFFKVITTMGSAVFLIISCAIIVLVLKNTLSLTIAIFMALEWLLNSLIKKIIKRDRPNVKRLVKEKGYSYPSGHTMSFTCFGGILTILVLTSPLDILLKIILIAFIILAIFMVGLSRIYLGVHYFSDIIGAVLISLNIIIIYVYLVSYILNIF